MFVHSISLTGKRKSNEDQHDIILNINGRDNSINAINYFGVYDGHGGKDVSKYLKENLSKYFIRNELDNNPKNNNYKKYISKVFDHIQNKLSIEYKNIANHVGSTALIMIHYITNANKSSYYIANIGDCRAVKCNKNNQAIQLTKDHKPNSPEEKNRIQELGGKVVYDGYDYRIMGLSLSRAFGDLDATPYVTHKPDIFKYDLLTGDKFIVMACDGLWDVMSNQQVVNFVINQIKKLNNTSELKSKNIAKLLASHAINTKGSTDNVSILIIFF
jgi:serine/threonine protein phosphatase PrpC